jgi:hypothetical protein
LSANARSGVDAISSLWGKIEDGLAKLASGGVASVGPVGGEPKSGLGSLVARPQPGKNSPVGGKANIRDARDFIVWL